jgi:ankyrin repeat protein
MSRPLPPKPNLAHLKKQAKELHRSQPQRKLAEAQHALANEYGFATWANLKHHVESLGRTPLQSFKAAVLDGDAPRVRELLAQYPELRAVLDHPLPDNDGQHALFAAVQRTDRATIDVLLEAGASIHKRTECPPDSLSGGFGVLDDCDSSLLDFLRERGAVLDAHSAARLSRLSELQQMVAADPAAVHARGADGQTPLHFAGSVQVAAFLLDHSADPDARGRNYESTPAQHMLRVQQRRHYHSDRQPIAAYLIARGAATDLLMAAALGDLALVRRHLDADPNCIRMSVSEEWFPKHDPRAAGTIYVPLLGAGRTAHTVARDFGHEPVFALLLERTPPDLKLALACELGDQAVFQELSTRDPGALQTLVATAPEKLPNAAQSNHTAAVRLMLAAGWPVDTPGDMGATSLHWAGFHGNAEMARELLRYHPALPLLSREYPGTALAWTIFGSGNSWHRDTGDYVATVRALLDAGAIFPPHAEELEPSDAVLELLS